MEETKGKSKVTDGVLEIYLENWLQFQSICEVFANNMGIYFRGQRDSKWKLRTTLDRFSDTLDTRVKGTYDKVLDTFIKAIRGKSQIIKNPEKNEDEIWALGQHNGLATPLLDWTSSAYIALFFAFETNEHPESKYRTVWGMHYFVSETMKEYNKDKNKYEEFKFVDPITDHNPRLLSQSGIFTKQPINFDVEQWVRKHFKDNTDKPVLFKIHIPTLEREKILKGLMLMNIHHVSIYPDIAGASKYCMTKLELISHKSKSMSDLELFEHATYRNKNTIQNND